MVACESRRSTEGSSRNRALASLMTAEADRSRGDLQPVAAEPGDEGQSGCDRRFVRYAAPYGNSVPVAHNGGAHGAPAKERRGAWAPQATEPGCGAEPHSTRGEGRCPVAPLVFKTSLGTVRSPEGSTPSLLRHFPRLRLGRGGSGSV